MDLSQINKTAQVVFAVFDDQLYVLLAKIQFKYINVTFYFWYIVDFLFLK